MNKKANSFTLMFPSPFSIFLLTFKCTRSLLRLRVHRRLLKQPSIKTHSPQGQSVGSGEKAGRKFLSSGERAPGHRLSQDHFQKFKRMPAPDWAQKMLCIIVPNRQTHLLSSVRVFVHDGRCLDHGLSVGKLSACYKIPIRFQNTVCPKTKDAFPKIQASAYNSYSRLHRPRLA